jgi:microcystin-dependent protein
MAQQFLSEIRVVPFNFAPQGWALCNGQILPISQNTALFSLLGTTFGGNGTSNFALPNLQGQVPIGMGNGSGLTPRPMGESGGEASVTLTVSELGAHDHALMADSSLSTTESPTNNLLAVSARSVYGSVGTSAMGSCIGNAGSTGGHENRQPYLVFNYIIALTGIFPSRE